MAAGDFDWHDAMADADVVLHLAARVHVMHKQKRGTRWLSFAGRWDAPPPNDSPSRQLDSPMQRLVYISSMKVMVESTLGMKPFHADDPPQPMDPFRARQVGSGACH